MADRATGPVKPPVIDLTARTARPEAEARPNTDTSARRGMSIGELNWPLLAGAVAGGAVLGTILTYLVALVFPLPGRAPDLSTTIAAQTSRIDTLEGQLATLKSGADGMAGALASTTTKLGADIEALKGTLADVKAAIPAPASPVDLGPLEAQMKALKTEVDALEAGVPGTDASDVAMTLNDVQTAVTSLTTRLNGVDSTLAALRTDIDAARKAFNDHVNASLPNEVGPALKLPLILSGLEDAFANGRPFEAELDSLASVLPAAAPPAALKAAAAGGLTRPDELMRAFEAKVPDILAARSISDPDWAARTADWLKSLLALRPAEEVEGDAPDAIVSRLEGAMARQDYAAATTLLASLPSSMQNAAGTVAADIAVHAAATTFVTDLRARALAAAETTP